MNDIGSLLIATSILAIGGLGLYMYKNGDDNDNDENDVSYNDDSVFSGNLFGPDDEEEEYPEDLEDDEYYEPKARTKGGKTKRNRKTTGTKRRR